MDEITRAADAIEARLNAMEPLERIRELDSATDAVSALRVRVGELRAKAVRDYVAQVGATAASKGLGISRNRVYQIMKEKP